MIGPGSICLLIALFPCGGNEQPMPVSEIIVPASTENHVPGGEQDLHRLLRTFGKYGVLPAGIADGPNGATIVCGYALPKENGPEGRELGSFSAIFGPDGDLESMFLYESEKDAREILELCALNGVRFR